MTDSSNTESRPVGRTSSLQVPPLAVVGLYLVFVASVISVLGDKGVVLGSGSIRLVADDMWQVAVVEISLLFAASVTFSGIYLRKEWGSIGTVVLIGCWTLFAILVGEFLVGSISLVVFVYLLWRLRANG